MKEASTTKLSNDGAKNIALLDLDQIYSTSPEMISRQK